MMFALPLDWSIVMRRSYRDVTDRRIVWSAAFLLLAWAHISSATTYMSVEPVPNRDVVGEENLAAIRSIGYANLERWSQRLLDECRVVDSVIDALSANAAISSVTSITNTRFVVAAGGFEGRTNPSFVLTMQDAEAGSVTEADVDVLSNALGYVLNQGGTAHFSPDNFNAYAFPLDYALVTFSGTLSGTEAQEFFEHVGTIDEALFSGQFAGFTQIDLARSTTNNSMLFLQPAVSKNQFISGLSAAVEDEPRATYSPLKKQRRADDGASGRRVSRQRLAGVSRWGSVSGERRWFHSVTERAFSPAATASGRRRELAAGDRARSRREVPRRAVQMS